MSADRHADRGSQHVRFTSNSYQIDAAAELTRSANSDRTQCSTSSAQPESGSGTVMPSALADLRLM
jgi:hypothetical protein